MRRNELQVQNSPKIPNPSKISTPEELHKTVRDTAVAIRQLWRKETLVNRRVADLEKLSERHWFHDLEVYNYNNSLVLPVRLQQDRDGDTGICMGCKDTLRWALAIDQSQSVFKISPECPLTDDYYFAMNMEGQIRVGEGVWIDDFSDDETFADLSATALVTERAIAAYVAGVIPAVFWDRNVALGYLFPVNLADNVGINTNTPLAEFVVNGSVHIGADADPGPPNTLVVDGSVGIGEIDPVSLLEVWDDNAHPIITLSAEHATDYDPQIQYRTDDPLTVKASHGVDGATDYFIIDIGVGGVGGSTDFVFNGTGLGIGVNPSTELDVNGHISHNADSQYNYFGAANDAGISYDGTNLIIDPDLVGTGIVRIGATGDNYLETRRIGVQAAPSDDRGIDIAATSTNEVGNKAGVRGTYEWTPANDNTLATLYGLNFNATLIGTKNVDWVVGLVIRANFYGSGTVDSVVGNWARVQARSGCTRTATGNFYGYWLDPGSTDAADVNIGGNGYGFLLEDYSTKGFPITGTAYGIKQEGATLINEFDGNINSGGMVRQNNTWHAYGGFEDEAETITCGVGDWNHITNGANDLWNLDENDGITEAADVFTITNTGDYTGVLSLSISATSQRDFHVRVYNNTQARVEGRPIGISTTGANNEVNVCVPIYIEATAGDTFQFEIMSTTGDDPDVDDGLFYLAYLHD